MPKDRVTLWITLIREKENPLVDFCPRQQFLHVLQTRCVCSTYCINYSSQQIYTKSRIPPYHIKLAPVTYSTWLQQSGWSRWGALKSTHHNFQFYDHTSQLFKNLEFVSLPLTTPLNRLSVQSIQDINPIPRQGFSTSDPNLPLENCVQQGERWVHSQDSPYFALTKRNSLKVSNYNIQEVGEKNQQIDFFFSKEFLVCSSQ